jgi:hypothetical protein
MQQNGENRPLRSGYRNPLWSNYCCNGATDPHTQGLAADFSILTASGTPSRTIFDALHDDAKDPDTTGAALKTYKMIACVEPWDFMLAQGTALHFHVDVVSTASCDQIHPKGW